MLWRYLRIELKKLLSAGFSGGLLELGLLSRFLALNDRSYRKNTTLANDMLLEHDEWEPEL